MQGLLLEKVWCSWIRVWRRCCISSDGWYVSYDFLYKYICQYDNLHSFASNISNLIGFSLKFRETAINDRPTLAINTASIRGDGGKDTCPRCEGKHLRKIIMNEKFKLQFFHFSKLIAHLSIKFISIIVSLFIRWSFPRRKDVVKGACLS